MFYAVPHRTRSPCWWGPPHEEDKLAWPAHCEYAPPPYKIYRPQFMVTNAIWRPPIGLQDRTHALTNRVPSSFISYSFSKWVCRLEAPITDHSREGGANLLHVRRWEIGRAAGFSTILFKLLWFFEAKNWLEHITNFYSLAYPFILRRNSPHFSTRNWGYVSWYYWFLADIITKVNNVVLVSM